MDTLTLKMDDLTFILNHKLLSYVHLRIVRWQYSGFSGMCLRGVRNNTLVSTFPVVNSVNLFVDMNPTTYKTYSLLPLLNNGRPSPVPVKIHPNLTRLGW